MLVRVLHLLAIATALFHAAEARTQPVVTLPTGAKVAGLVENNRQGKPVNKYLGIRFTDAPIGDLRWKQSKVKELTEDVNATAYGDVCHGNPALDAASGQFPNNEDCLFLNVYTPADATPESKLPVMVWIHGGGYIAGAGNVYDGGNLIGASGQKIIVVNFNYRLGALGFFQNEEILAEGDGANFGLRDQETAFLWVKKYISAFGGDPDDITAFGESAGAMSLGHHLLAHDGNQQIFQRAILQSGGFTPVQSLPTKAQQAQQSSALAKAVGCDKVEGSVLDCLRQVPARAIFNASQTINNGAKIDGVYVQRAPFLSLLQGKVSRVPTIIGANTDDGYYNSFSYPTAAQFDSFVRSNFPMLTPDERKRLAELYPASAFKSPQFRVAEIASDNIFMCAGEIFSALNSATVKDTYRYRFNFATSEFGLPLVLHAKDLDYVFDRKYNLPNTTDAETVVGHFQKFWTNFAVTGSPNGAVGATQTGSTEWPRYDVVTKKQIILQPTLESEADAAYMPGHSERCAFWWEVETRLAPTFDT